ncbi:hypothetical protein [Mycoplasma phage MGyu-2021a]|nr:hypothetical protein [Mycoplasma phage MGyu-2021a]
MARKDKIITPSVTKKLQQLGYNVADWDDSSTDSKINQDIKSVLNKSSKNGSGNPGFPDRIYFNKNQRLLILVEEKPTIKEHYFKEPEKGAISGIKWYLSRFIEKIDKFKRYKILGIAVSGDLGDEYNHKFNCYKITNSQIDEVKQITNFVREEEFLAIFENFDEEEAIEKISKSSKTINKLLRNIDSQQRPVILSMLMIALYKPKDYNNVFARTFREYDKGSGILEILYPTIKDILKMQNIPENKISILETYIGTYKQMQDLTNTDIIKKILIELEENVIPIFNNHFATRSNYDIIGKFYEEFLKYAGVSNVKKGIVLTPKHITTLFTKLVDIKYNDVIMDLCCGTGAFLIAGMNKLIELIENSELPDKEKIINNIKQNQLLGFEINPTMYICSISNMLFRGDGKSRIFNMDSINNEEANKIIKEMHPTIGFINPPYSGKENSTDPTPKEITFVTKMLDNCSRYGIVIAPLSMYFKDKERRQQILQRHTLKYVINMPSDLFKPNASTYTAIAVFETNRPHKYESDIVKFYDFDDDGLVMTIKGRTDIYNRYNEKERELLDFLQNNQEVNDEKYKKISCTIKPDDEWNVHFHTKTNYSKLSKSSFEKTIKEFIIYNIKKEFDIVEKDLSDFELISYIAKSSKFKDLLEYINSEKNNENIDVSTWKEFPITQVFENMKADEKNNKINYETGELKNTNDLIQGEEIYYVGAKKTNNGVLQKVSKIDDLITKGGCLAFITGGDGSGGYSLYLPDDVIASKSFITIGRTKNLNVYTAMFLVTILDQHRYKFSYGRTWSSERFENTLILLPQTNEGKIDWNLMNNYIKNLEISKLLEE